MGLDDLAAAFAGRLGPLPPRHPRPAAPASGLAASVPASPSSLSPAAVLVPLLVQTRGSSDPGSGRSSGSAPGSSGLSSGSAPGSSGPLAPGALELLFIVRPETMTRHAGQVAFPGGRTDPGDADPAATALRETSEELGVPVSVPRLVGALPPAPTPSGYLVTPVVALIPQPIALYPDPREVARHFTVPLATLCAGRGRRRMLANRRGTPGSPPVPLHFWVDTPEVIWGVTGHILDALLARAAPLLGFSPEHP